MKQLVYIPYDKSYKVIYAVNSAAVTYASGAIITPTDVAGFDNIMVQEVKTDFPAVLTSGQHPVYVSSQIGLTDAAKAAGFTYNTSEQTTMTAMKAMATTLNMTMYIFEENQSTVTVNTALDPLADFLTFTLPGQSGSSVIVTTTNTVAINVPYGTSLTALAATFTTSPSTQYVKVSGGSQTSGSTTNNFSSPVTYTLESASGSIETYTVTVTTLANTATVISAFTIPSQTGGSTINGTAHTVAITMPHLTTVTALVSTFTLSAQATANVGTTAQVSTITANNFTNPVVYKVTAGDGVTEQDWTVTVTVASS